jgi:hypothetical protein
MKMSDRSFIVWAAGDVVAAGHHPADPGRLSIWPDRNEERPVIESVKAFVQALKMYLAIGLVVSAVNAVAVHPPAGDSRLARAEAIVQDVVLWPRFIGAAMSAVDGRLATLPLEDRPFLYSLLRSGLKVDDHP